MRNQGSKELTDFRLRASDADDDYPLKFSIQGGESTVSAKTVVSRVSGLCDPIRPPVAHNPVIGSGTKGPGTQPAKYMAVSRATTPATQAKLGGTWV